MSDEESEPGVLGKAYRTVSPRYESRPLFEMNIVGWGMLLGLLILVVPLLPFIVLVWVLTKLFDLLSNRVGDAESEE